MRLKKITIDTKKALCQQTLQMGNSVTIRVVAVWWIAWIGAVQGWISDSDVSEMEQI
jgi:hypothetical protein